MRWNHGGASAAPMTRLIRRIPELTSAHRRYVLSLALTSRIKRDGSVTVTVGVRHLHDFDWVRKNCDCIFSRPDRVDEPAVLCVLTFEKARITRRHVRSSPKAGSSQILKDIRYRCFACSSMQSLPRPWVRSLLIGITLLVYESSILPWPVGEFAAILTPREVLSFQHHW